MSKMDSRTPVEVLPIISGIFNPITRQAVSLLLICALGLFASAAFALSLPIFPDPNLQSCFDEQARENGWQTVIDVDELVCVNRGISNLSGLSWLPNLRSVDFSGNRIRDLYPLTNGNLPWTLTELRLADNRINDIVYLFAYGQLTLLDLSGNSAIDFGVLRQIIEQNSRLTRLRLGEIRIAQDESLSFVGLNTNQPLPLVELDVSNTGITRLKGVETYSGLENLNASGNRLLDLYNLHLPPTLRELYLAETGIYDALLLERCHNLIVLDLSENRRINFPSLRPMISQNSRLARLRLRGIPLAASESLIFYSPDTGLPLPLIELDVSETGIRELSGVEAYVGLEVLNASGNRLLGLNNSQLPPTLRELYLVNTGIYDTSPLERYHNLTVLDLSENRHIDFPSLRPTIEQNSGLTRLRLRGIPLAASESLIFNSPDTGLPLPLIELDVSETGIQELSGVEAYVGLEILNASGNRLLDLNNLQLPPTLRELYLAESGIYDTLLLARCYNLTVLDLSENRRINFPSLRPMIAQNSRLARLRLRGIPLAAYERLFFYNPDASLSLPLIELDVSETGLRGLNGVEAYVGLEILNASGNPGLNLHALSVGNLSTSLRELYLADTRILGVPPLADYTHLSALDLSGNPEIDFSRLQPIIEQNQELRHLGLADIAINSSRVPWFYNWDTGMPLFLTELDLSRTGLGSLMDIGYYEDLRVLAVSGNGLTNLDPLDFFALYSPDQLKRLDLSANRLEHILPLLDMTGLSQVDLRETTTLPCDQLDQLERQLEPGGLLRPASCVVGSRPALMLNEPLDGLVAFEGELVTLSALATDPEDGDISDLIEWSSNQGVIGTGTAIEYRLLLGDQTITARVTDSDGRSASASVNIKVQPNHAPVVAIVKPVSGITIIEGTAVELSAEAQDVEDGPLSDAVIWSSDIQGDLGSGGSIQATLSVGTHTLNARVSDSLGKEAVATTAVTVLFNNPPQLTVESPSQGAATEQYLPVHLAASANDVESGDLSSNITWSSDISGSLGAGDRLDVTLPVGVHTLTVQVVDPLSRKISAATRTVTVNASPQFAYCATGGEHSERSWIEHVDISDTSNTSGNQGGYGDFAGLGPIYLQSGRNHSIRLTPGFSSSVFALRWQVWIDLNRDGQFGSDELVLSARGSRPVSSEFTLPATSVAGHTRMRIVMRKDRRTDACGNFSVGEVEDYSVVLLP